MESEEIKMKAPCKNCMQRNLGCHSKCDKYQAFRTELDSINAKRKAERDFNDFIHSVRSARFA
jgi:hypothetical protein